LTALTDGKKVFVLDLGAPSAALSEFLSPLAELSFGDFPSADALESTWERLLRAATPTAKNPAHVFTLIEATP